MERILTIGNLGGYKIAELDVLLDPISWRLNNIGQTKFSIPISNPKATKDILHIGNRILIQFDNGLPNWGGTIELPREWSENKVICTALSAENILGNHITVSNASFAGMGAGAILHRILPDVANIKIGDVVDGIIAPHEYHWSTVADVIKDLNVDFDIVPTLENGVIIFTVNLYNSKGLNKPKIVLIEGQNVQSARLMEQGPLINNFYVAGKGSDWNNRLISSALDLPSIMQYNTRQASAIYVDIDSQAALDVKAQALVDESRQPHNILELVTIDMAPAYFKDYDIGDTVTVQLYSYGFGGFSGQVHILSREVDTLSGTARLIVQEVLP